MHGEASWLFRAPGNIERIEASFSGAAFAPHRHDTYAIGITLKGVQSFDYRGSARHSLPGQFVILHPDEVHDGRAGDDAPFRYRTAYIAPALIQGVLGGRSLPFVEGGVSRDIRLQRPISALLENYRRPLDELEQQDVLFELANALQAVSGTVAPINSVNRKAAMRARDYLETCIEQNVSLADLERETHRDRWQLSRDFRAMFGTSPYRYQIARRLDKARRMMLRGRAIAEVALRCGFSDQSHFGRAFKKTFGLTPNAWLRVSGGAQDRSIRAAGTRPR
ncbi:MAG: AraC family transcriptional regulator [Rhizomicrobium sp.]|jgi:AraC-like DNA-binding protein